MCKSMIGMANINAKEIQAMRIAEPPKELQRDFARRIAARGGAEGYTSRLGGRIGHPLRRLSASRLPRRAVVSNFSFLRSEWPHLSAEGENAETLVIPDPRAGSSPIKHTQSRVGPAESEQRSGNKSHGQNPETQFEPNGPAASLPVAENVQVL